MRFLRSTPVAATAAALLLASAAVAEGEQAENRPRGGCRAEIEALCPDTEPRSAERRACVRENGSKLPEVCRDRMMRGRNRASAGIEGLRQACGEAIDGHCDEMRQGRMLRCLRAQEEDELSERCRGYLEILAGMRERRAPGASAGE